jgi:hypothetical protein
MKTTPLSLLATIMALAAGLPPSSNAETAIVEGFNASVKEIHGPDDLHLDPSMLIIAVDSFGDENRTVNGVLFLTDKSDLKSVEKDHVLVRTAATNTSDDSAPAPQFKGGSGTSADNLAEIMRDGRWDFAPNPVRVEISGLPGKSRIEVQLLFNEGAERDLDRRRRFDIGISENEDGLIFDDISSEGDSEDEDSRWTPENSFVATFEVVVPANGELDIVLKDDIGGQPTPGEPNDINPIIQAVIIHGAESSVGRWTFEEDEELIDRSGNFPDLTLKRDATITDGQLDVNGAGTVASGWAVTRGNYQGEPIVDKTLVSWLTLESLSDVAKAGSALTIDRRSSDHFDGIVFGERQDDRWMNGSSGFGRTEDFDPGFQETETGRQVMLAITYEHKDGVVEITGYRGQAGVAEVARLGQYQKGASNWDTEDAEVFFGLRHGSTNGGPGALDARIEEARIYGEAFTKEQIQSIFNRGPQVAGDQDGDGLNDTWELRHFGNIVDQGALDDPDKDGLNNVNEEGAGTDPIVADSDGDGVMDGAETTTGRFVSATDTGTNPLEPDTDEDKLVDGVETGTGIFVDANNTGTDPNERDSDGDSFLDGVEVAELFTNPNDASDPARPPVRLFLVGQWTFEPGEEIIDTTGNFPDLLLVGDAVVEDGKLDVNGEGTQTTDWAVTNSKDGKYVGPVIESKTLVSWVILQSLDHVAKAGSVITLDKVTEDQFDGIVFAERQPNSWMAGSSFFGRTEDFDPGLEEGDEVLGTLIKLAITYEHLEDGGIRMTGYREAVEAGEKILKLGQYEKETQSRWEAGDAEVFFGKRHGSIVGGLGGLDAVAGAIDALIEEARIYNKVLTEPEIEALSLGPVTIFQITNAIYNAAANTLAVTWTSNKGKTFTVETSEDLKIWDEITDGFPDDGATEATTTFTIEDIPEGITELYVRVREERF